MLILIIISILTSIGLFIIGKVSLNRWSALQDAIEKHHRQRADDRCFMDDEELYAAAGLPPADVRVGDPEAMLENCKRFIKNRCVGGGPWVSYRQLEQENGELKKTIQQLKDELATWGGPSDE